MALYKLVCIDVDGTLVNSKHEVSSYTKQVITGIVHRNNLLVVPVSARMPKSIAKILRDDLSLNMPFIGFNGSVVIGDIVKQKVLEEKSISLEVTNEVYEDLRYLDLNISFYKGSDWFVNRLDAYTSREETITNVQPSYQSDFDQLKYSWANKSGPNKILVIGNEKLIKELEAKLAKKYASKLTIYRSKPDYLEIISSNCSKTLAIDLLAKYYSIDQSEIIAIGDNYNDIDMLQYAGYSVAMGNAPKEVKKHANHITSTNDEDGVAKALITILAG